MIDTKDKLRAALGILSKDFLIQEIEKRLKKSIKWKRGKRRNESTRIWCLIETYRVLESHGLTPQVIAGSAKWRRTIGGGDNESTTIRYNRKLGTEMHRWLELNGEVIDFSTRFLMEVGTGCNPNILSPKFIWGARIDPNSNYLYRPFRKATKIASELIERQLDSNSFKTFISADLEEILVSQGVPVNRKKGAWIKGNRTDPAISACLKELARQLSIPENSIYEKMMKELIIRVKFKRAGYNPRKYIRLRRETGGHFKLE